LTEADDGCFIGSVKTTSGTWRGPGVASVIKGRARPLACRDPRQPVGVRAEPGYSWQDNGCGLRQNIWRGRRLRNRGGPVCPVFGYGGTVAHIV